MCEGIKNEYKENQSKILRSLIEAASLLYVLQMALDKEQPTKDTTPFSDLADVIRRKLQAIIEKLAHEQIINK